MPRRIALARPRGAAGPVPRAPSRLLGRGGAPDGPVAAGEPARFAYNRAPMRARLPLGLALASLLGAAPVGATWSVVAVDTATGEVCVAAATCINQLDLKRELAVLRVGEGAAAAQSLIDVGGANRRTIWDGFVAGTGTNVILSQLAASDSLHEQRQYGIANATHPPVKFTGQQAGGAKHAVRGIAGSLRYAVQGNVLTGKLVVFDARDALLATRGDLGQRVMAAMEAARALGGDGRCSCDLFDPTGCGVPPTAFAKSSAVAFVVLARPGDTDGDCNAQQGCANGQYYLDLGVTRTGSTEDPVVLLRGQYDAWRAGLAGRPDHVLSRVTASAAALPADGRATATVAIELVDVEGVPLASGGAAVELVPLGGSAGLVAAGRVEDRGDGSYGVVLTAGTATGTARFAVEVDDGSGRVRLHPELELRLDPAASLHAGFDGLSAALGGVVPFTLDLGAARAGAPYRLLASASGTDPGQRLGGLVLPLNPDPVLDFTRSQAGSPAWPDGAGTLDAEGRAQASLVAPPGALASLAGRRLAWAAIGLGPSPAVSDVATLSIVP